MTLLSDIISASANLHHSNHLPSDEYDRRIRDLVEYFRRLQTTKALDSFANDESFLDRISAPQEGYGHALHIFWPVSMGFKSDTLDENGAFLLNSWGKPHKLHQWQPLLGATLVKDAMLRLDPSCAVFTSTHLLLVRLCLQAKAYSCALPVLNKQICHFPISLGRPSSDPSVLCADHSSGVSFMTEASGVSSKLSFRDYLQYFLYGGMVYMALKQWRNALHFLGIVISTPSTNSVSLIMVEAYKKWVLVGLLEKGKFCPPPSITTPHVVKVYQSLARPYVILAHAFERGDLKRLNAEIDAAKGVWCADNNLGLVSQVVGAFFSQTVIKLGKTFAALTMADLSKQVFPSPVCVEVTGSAVSSLIMSSALNATLVETKDHAEASMLRFSSIHSLPQLSRELDLQSQLKQEMKLMETLVINLGETNNNLGLSDEYVDSLHKGQVWSGSSEVNPIIGGEAGLEMDEDLMGDMS
ncbi:hypothetical protein PENSOL_c054G09568 [Penicillium solitum]|uniref:COP9 signalosome complex subunit 3 N-terminal helical repeats domain-containing protein n=1 Tax=Penicillium solitum TaxID=60172 RepID=A0A1V6QQY7_9EURO|nr:uncharacterized protein PENSOL_c054G09568 [Penicillium solitum]OQD91417.1 hypothetical protein PENSOL_c054G09568 [Penicillium solitum]